jgi:signal transduction histidine kinase
MLEEFLKKYESEILALAESKTLELAGTLSSSHKMRQGLPEFYKQLIKFLQGSSPIDTEANLKAEAGGHGREMLRLNYSLSHVVHAYGAICQSITGLAQRKGVKISSEDFNTFNLCLDVAIASAVSEYQYRSNEMSEERESKNLGFLAHELRNTLSSATIAHSMIKQGLVGTGGSTAMVLEESLIRMRVLIDRSLSEVRMRTNADPTIENFDLGDLIDQIVLTAEVGSLEKKQVLESDIKVKIEIESDRQLLLTVIANTVQNAIKYTKRNGHILISAELSEKSVVVKVEDECGGIDEDQVKDLFKPFKSGTQDKSGLGIGLTIVKQATSLLQGKISVENNPGCGCTFVLEIPQKYEVSKIPKTIAEGKDSVQPKIIPKSK